MLFALLVTGCFPCCYCSISSCYERFAGNFSLIVVIQSLSKWPHSASSPAEYGKFIMKWRLPGAASGSLAPRARSPEVTHGAALARAQSPFGLSPYLAWWALRGRSKWLHHNRLSGSAWKCCPLPLGEGLGV